MDIFRRLPPSPDGEWWEMTDEASGMPYYYHTKTGDTVWDRPQAFVIPLGVLQVRQDSASRDRHNLDCTCTEYRISSSALLD